MERIRNVLRRQRSRSPSYEPLNGESHSNGTHGDRHSDSPKVRFSWLEYSIFLLLGVSMLWAW